MTSYIISDPKYGALDTMNANDMVSVNLGYDEAFGLAMNLLSGIHANSRQRDQRRGGGDIGDVTIRNSFVARVTVRADKADQDKPDATIEQPAPVAYSRRVADALILLRKHYRSLPDEQLTAEERVINDVLWILEGEPGAKPGPWPGDPVAPEVLAQAAVGTELDLCVALVRRGRGNLPCGIVRREHSNIGHDFRSEGDTNAL